jgi:hypothetical protein
MKKTSDVKFFNKLAFLRGKKIRGYRLVVLLSCFLIGFSTIAEAEPETTNGNEPGFLDKATELTNKAIDKSKQVAKDVIDKSTDVTNDVIKKSEQTGKKVINKATELTNKVLDSKNSDEEVENK